MQKGKGSEGVCQKKGNEKLKVGKLALGEEKEGKGAASLLVILEVLPIPPPPYPSANLCSK